MGLFEYTDDELIEELNRRGWDTTLLDKKRDEKF